MVDKPHATVDLLTVAGVSGLAYVLTALAHEGGGHGGMCLAVGARPAVWGAYYFDCDTHGLPAISSRLVAAAGSTVNLILAVLFAAVLRARLAAPGPTGAIALLLWIMATINGLTWAGYYAFSGIANVGDWSATPDGVLAGLSPGAVLVGRIALTMVGAAAYIAVAAVSARLLARMVGGERRRLGWRVASTTYVAGGAAAVLISLPNPVGLFITLASAVASSLGGTSGLLWIPRRMPATTPAADWSLPRRWAWIAAGLVAVVVYTVVWGPSLKLGH